VIAMEREKHFRRGSTRIKRFLSMRISGVIRVYPRQKTAQAVSIN
jgi:hypothetical protein